MTRLFGLIAATLALLANVPAAQAAKAVGTTAAVNPQATGQPPGEPSRTLVIGNQLVFKERIDTSGKGLVQVLLLDGTSLTVGPGSSVIIDEFVYDPNAGTGKLVINFSKGAMRFIGGKLSKNEAALVKTPLGTLGIRGGIANLVVQGKEGTFSLLFGKELTLNGSDGETKSVFQQGYTIDLKPGGSVVRKLTANDVKILKTLLSGAGGGGGGASKPPTDEDVADSGLTEVNSELTPDTSQDGQVVKATETGELQADISNDISTTTNTPPVPTRSYQVRSLSAPEPSYNVSFGPIISDPGARGLVGGTDDPDADEVFTAEQTAANILTVSDGIDTINVPFNSNPGTYPVSFLDFDGNPQVGTMFIGLNADFLFYSLFENGDINQPTYAFGGVPTPAAGQQGGDRLLTYDLFADPQQGIAMPFTPASLVTDPELAFVSPLYLMAPEGVAIGDESDMGTTGGSNVLAGSLLINGQGASQNSAVSLLVGQFFIDTETGQAEYGSGDRGSIRAAADEGSLVAGGSIASIAGPEGSSFFGQNANNFVLNYDSPNNGAIGYNGVRFDEYNGQDELLFGTTHVANQVNSEAQSSLTRSTKTFTGYAAGMLESRNYYDPDNTNPDAIAYRSTSSEDMSLGFDASRDTMSASMEIEDVQIADGNTSSYNFGFGYSALTGGNGRGAYVDDDRYGATGSNDPDATFVTTDPGAGSGSTVAGMDTGIGNYAYLFGSELAPQTNFFSADNAPCTCKFLEWGYWGTEVEWTHTQDNEPHSHVDNFHLGTWVAGDVTDDVDLPTEGTASYSGHAVGNVARFDGPTTNQYVAGGGFDMSWNFAERNGIATISDFDGVTVSGDMNALPELPTAANGFSGVLVGGFEGGVSGGLNGSFVTGPDGPTQGVIGSFDLIGVDFVATGIVAGEQLGP